MRTIVLCVFILATSVFAVAGACAEQVQRIELPPPVTRGDMSLEESLSERRSNRRFARADLSLKEVGQLFWAAQGKSDARGFRTAPSAGARYPLSVTVLRPGGLFRYLPSEHVLVQVSAADLRKSLWSDVYSDAEIGNAPAIFVISADYRKTRKKYGKRADRYVHIEAGHAGQNLLLQATALGLHCVGIGAFHGARVKKRLSLPAELEPLYILAVGRPTSKQR